MADRQPGASRRRAWWRGSCSEHGVDRVFGLQGGHIQPIWDQLARRGVRIVDVRDEGSAVHMAHAHTELTGETAVAMVTAGPGVTNTVTAVANASVSRIPLLLIGGCPPIPQSNMGPLQDIPHTAILAPVTRLARTLRNADQVLREFDEAWARGVGRPRRAGPGLPRDPHRRAPSGGAPGPADRRAPARRSRAVVRSPTPTTWPRSRTCSGPRRSRRSSPGAARGRPTGPTSSVSSTRAAPPTSTRRRAAASCPDSHPAAVGRGPLGGHARHRPADHRRPPARLPARAWGRRRCSRTRRSCVSPTPRAS